TQCGSVHNGSPECLHGDGHSSHSIPSILDRASAKSVHCRHTLQRSHMPGGTMAGLLRNLITLLLALPRLGSVTPAATLRKAFRITPLDTGLRHLKSDRYLLLAECAQLDFVLRTGLLGRLLRGGIGFVNGSQLVRFRRPVRLWSRLEVRTRV